MGQCIPGATAYGHNGIQTGQRQLFAALHGFVRKIRDEKRLTSTAASGVSFAIKIGSCVEARCEIW
nr:hypothetical protein [uncultured bacterium]